MLQSYTAGVRPACCGSGGATVQEIDRILDMIPILTPLQHNPMNISWEKAPLNIKQCPLEYACLCYMAEA